MIILLSPSKTQETGDRAPDFTLPEMLEKTRILVEKLQRLSTIEISDMYQISTNLAETTRQRFARFCFPPDVELCRQALLTFRGDVFAEIDADRYTTENLCFAQNRLRILSGLYGILRPLDLIQPYRLEMGGRFRPTKSRI